MDYKHLKNNVLTMGKVLHQELYFRDNATTGKLSCSWDGALEDVVYEVTKSPEYIAFCDKYNLVNLCASGCRFEGEGRELVAYPYEKNYSGFNFVKAVVSDNSIVNPHARSGKKTIGMVVIHNGKKIRPDISRVNYSYRFEALDFDEYIGEFDNGILYRSYDCIYFISSTGTVVDICSYPYDTESGKVYLYYDGKTIKIKTLVYLDNDHHHSDYECVEYDIPSIVKAKLQ